MKLLSSVAASAVLLAGAVEAYAPPASYVTQVCFTSQLSVKPKTTHRYTTSLTTKNTHTVTSTTTKFVTPKAATSTSTVVPTTVVTVTGVPTTDTAFATSTGTETDTSTTNTVITTVVSTTVDGGPQYTTIAASAGFEPISDTIPGSTYSTPGSKKARKRNGGSAVEERSSPNPKNKLAAACKYPGDVHCYKYYDQCTTKTVWHTRTSTVAQPTVTATVTSTYTSTFTTTPGVQTTSTQTVSTTTVTTVTTTDVSTSVATATTYSSTVTSYAACATSNFANYVNGQGIIDGSPDYDDVNQMRNPATDPYDCCVAALLTPGGAYWAFVQNANVCVLLVDNTASCPANQGDVAHALYDGTTPAYTFGNAYCGQWQP